MNRHPAGTGCSPADSWSIDIVDYPGEWLLDLPLLGKSFQEFSKEAVELSALPVRADLAGEWRKLAAAADPNAQADEMTARRLAEAFADYLRACKHDERALSTLPPGRFLMPGDLDGSPALTFSPLVIKDGQAARPGSLHAMMERRYEAYKTHVIKPFFREHIARLDRQIVLVDALQALNAGPWAIADLERALAEILTCFRIGRGGFLTDLFSHRIDRILIAATKADHLHHESHDRLQAIVKRIAEPCHASRPISAARRWTCLPWPPCARHARARSSQGRDKLPVIIGTPLEGERIGDEIFDGKTETAIFPAICPARLKRPSKRLTAG